jgi:AsmA protein
MVRPRHAASCPDERTKPDHRCRVQDELIPKAEAWGGILMMFQRTRRYALVLIGIGLIPLFLWAGLLLIAPTGWARRQVIAALESRSGRSVRLDSLSVHVFGGLRLTNLSIGSPQDTARPWFQAAEIRLDTGLSQLLRGRLKPSTVEVDRASLRVFRRGDGSLELSDLVHAESTERSRPGSKSAATCQPESLEFHLTNGKIELIDEPSHTHLHVEDVSGEGLIDGRVITVRKLEGTLNGGIFRLAGQLDASDAYRVFDVALSAESVVLDDGMIALRYVIPPINRASLKWKGRLSCDAQIQGRGSDWGAVSRTLEGRGTVALDSIDLDGAPLVNELTKLGKLSRQRRVATIHSDFVLKDRRIITEASTITIGSVPLAMDGWTDFDGRIDYRIKALRLEAGLSERARRFLNDIDLDINQLTTFTLRGTVDDMVVGVNGINLDRNALRENGLRPDDREKLKLLGRQLRDRLLR